MDESNPGDLSDAAERSDALFVLWHLAEGSPSGQVPLQAYTLSSSLTQGQTSCPAQQKSDALYAAVEATVFHPPAGQTKAQLDSLSRSQRLVLEILLLTGAYPNARCSKGWTASERVLSAGPGVASRVLAEWDRDKGANCASFQTLGGVLGAVKLTNGVLAGTDALAALTQQVRDSTGEHSPLEDWLREHGYELPSDNEHALDGEPMDLSDSDEAPSIIIVSNERSHSPTDHRSPLSPSQEPPPTTLTAGPPGSSSDHFLTAPPPPSSSSAAPAVPAVITITGVPCRPGDTLGSLTPEFTLLFSGILPRSHIGSIAIRRVGTPQHGHSYQVFVELHSRDDANSAIIHLSSTSFCGTRIFARHHLAEIPRKNLFLDELKPSVTRAALDADAKQLRTAAEAILDARSGERKKGLSQRAAVQRSGAVKRPGEALEHAGEKKPKE